MSEQTTQKQSMRSGSCSRIDARFQETDQTAPTGRFVRYAVGSPAGGIGRSGGVAALPRRGIDIHSSYQRQGASTAGPWTGYRPGKRNRLGGDRGQEPGQCRGRQRLPAATSLIPAYFTRFAGRHIYGAIARLEFAADADRYAYRQGLFVLGLTGDGLVQIQNSDQFQPTNFGNVDTDL